MKKSPWALFAIYCLVTLTVVIGSASLRVERCVPTRSKPCPDAGWLPETALWLKPHALDAILYATLLGFIVQAGERAFGAWAFRKGRVEKFLDKIVGAQLKADPRQHRLTLFKRVRGPKAKLLAIWRLKNVEDKNVRRRKWATARAIRLRGTYLYVYARAAHARNRASSVAWRIYPDQGGSEGIAGRAWDEGDVVIARDLPLIQPQALNGVRTLGEAGPDVQQYAEMANIRDIVQVKAMRHVAQHFMGVMIETPSGEPWGVLLVDSMKEQCPFPKAQEKTFRKQFRDYATMLSLLLS